LKAEGDNMVSVGTVPMNIIQGAALVYTCMKFWLWQGLYNSRIKINGSVLKLLQITYNEALFQKYL
jgi:hypothetical protein